MKKRILSIVLAVLLCLSLFACSGPEVDEPKDKDQAESKASETIEETLAEGESDGSLSETEPDETNNEEQSQPEKGSTPLLYKVSDDKGNVVWLFGSIHLGRESYYPLPDYVTEAFENSDALAVECDIVAFENDISAQVSALQKMLYTDGTTIKDHISEDTYNKAKKILQDNNMYSFAIDYYKPILWESFLDSCVYALVEADSDLGIDMHLLNLAKKNGKEVLEVESVGFQYGMLSSFSEELQIYLLESAIEGFEDTDALIAELNEMLDIWAKGDEKEFSDYLGAEEEFEDEKEEQLYEEYNNAMLVSRNKNMTEYAENALKSGKEVFICVGAAHVVGKGAMAEQLRNLGYNVELVK